MRKYNIDKVLLCLRRALRGLAFACLAGLSAAVQAADKPVLLYGAPATQAWLARGALLKDGPAPVQVWERFLRKYQIGFESSNSVERLETSTAQLLLLPSTAVLSEREQAAVLAFRARGGSLLSTWQTATRDEQGQWRGYNYMETLLGLKVAGSTEKEEDDSFLIVHGDNPIAHHLDAGMRVWTERVAGWYPLRLEAAHAAAHVMDWSRTRVAGRSSATVVFDEREAGPGKSSRAVTFGFPERLWQSANPALLEPLAHNALTWLLRTPDAYIPAWPHPHHSAALLAIDLANTPQDSDLDLGKLASTAGGRASYYVLSEHVAAPETVALLARIKAAGHELGYLGDRFEGYKDASTAVQTKRLDLMLEETKALALGPGAGMHPPMELFDATTVRLAQARAIAYLIVGQDSSDARLPLFAPTPAASSGAAAPAPASPPMVLLPRTQGGLEDLLAEGDAAAGMQSFFRDLELNEQMGGLSILQLLGQSTLTAPQLAEVGARLNERRAQRWIASGAQLAGWWRARARLQIALDTLSSPPVLSVTIGGTGALEQGAVVWVNLPVQGSTLRLAALGATPATPGLARVDAWRDAVLLQGLAPGTYRWQLLFDRTAPRAPPPP